MSAITDRCFVNILNEGQSIVVRRGFVAITGVNTRQLIFLNQALDLDGALVCDHQWGAGASGKDDQSDEGQADPDGQPESDGF